METTHQAPLSASPLLITVRIFASDDRGKTLVSKATSDGFKKLTNGLFGDSSIVSFIRADGKMLLRHATTEAGQRKELLYAISKTAEKTSKMNGAVWYTTAKNKRHA